MGFAPWIERKCGADGVLRLGLDGEHHAVFVGERPAQDDETRIDKAVHK
jgi:hypothetical protein